jgi:hypothetical protein
VADFESLKELKHNRGLIANPKVFAQDANAASWLFLCGEEFATIPGRMTYSDVQAAVPESSPRTNSRRGSRKGSRNSPEELSRFRRTTRFGAQFSASL